jgi:hypothetical protein
MFIVVENVNGWKGKERNKNSCRKTSMLLIYSCDTWWVLCFSNLEWKIQENINNDKPDKSSIALICFLRNLPCRVQNEHARFGSIVWSSKYSGIIYNFILSFIDTHYWVKHWDIVQVFENNRQNFIG